MIRRFEWLVPNRVILEQFGPDITPEDVRQATLRMQAVQDQSTQTLHMLVDFRETRHYPRDVLGLMRAMPPAKIERLGTTVVLAHDPLLHFLAQLYVRLAGASLVPVRTVDQALHTLAEADTELDLATLRQAAESLQLYASPAARD